MAAFPAIEPIGRSYGLGAHPMVTASFSSLDEVRFLQSSTLSGVPIALDFRALSISEATEIRNHYIDQREHRSFTLNTGSISYNHNMKESYREGIKMFASK